MPWNNDNVELAREEFVRLATQSGSNISQLCELFHISRKTGYKWIKRSRLTKPSRFSDASKKPHHIAHPITDDVREKIITVRCLFPHWGAKKIKAYLLNQHMLSRAPAISTINKILSKEGLMRIHQDQRHYPYKQFEYESPNQLWQMDFKGYFSLLEGCECHPLTIIDDHSRYLVCLIACSNEQLESVKSALIKTFSRYGLPDAIALDNGSCWKPKSRQHWSELTVWLMRLGIHIIHGSPYHPQSRGKDERLHRTLKMELINEISMKDLADAQQRFDAWRHCYNHVRPHEALNLQPPVTRYQPSKRHFPRLLPPIQYWEDDMIRHVDQNGYVHIAGLNILLSKSLRYQPVAIRSSRDGEKLHIFFCQRKIKSINHPKQVLKKGRSTRPVY